MRAPQDAARPRRRRRLSRRGRIIVAVVLVALLVLFLSLRGIAGFYTDYLWFDSLHLRSVWTQLLAAKILLGLIFTGAFFALLWVNLLVADRIAPRFRPSGPEEELLERYFEMVGRRSGLVRVAVSLLFAIIAGAGVSQQWNNWILFTHRVDFGRADPLFKVDIGFYVFQLPFLSFLVSWLFAAFVIILIITTVAHYLNGGIRLQTPMQRVTPQVKAHLSVLLGVLALVKAAGYWLQRYELTVAHTGFVQGAGYTDVKAKLPAIMLLLFISFFSFALFIYNIRRRGWVLPVLAVGLWGFVALVAGSAYPWFVQRFRVEPAESSKEAPYIARNIAATKQAYELDGVQSRTFTADQPLQQSDLQTPSAKDTVRNLRVLDPEIVDDTFQKRQADLGWLRFPDNLDVDRYQIDGKTTQVVVGARELNPANLPQKSWEASRLIYTHGYGMAMAPANEVDPSSREPIFLVGGLPVDVSQRIGVNLPDQQAGLYYSENLSGYAIIKTQKQEIGWTTEPHEYAGETGVGIGSYVRRMAFALRFGDINPLISGSIDSNSRLLFVRDVRSRVAKVAPFLDLDSDPYPVVSGGRVLYVVDAYDGSVKLYIVPGPDGEIDPIVQAYQKAFPKLFHPLSEMSTDLQQHLRHPEDLYRIQTTVWGRYHVDQPDQFYSGTRQWVVAQRPPRDVTAAAAPARTAPAPGLPAPLQPAQKERIPPQYVLMTLPGEDQEQYVSIRSFVPVSEDDQKEELTGFMAAKPDGSLVVYNIPTPDVPGPSLATSAILSNQDISREVTLLGQQGSKVEFGNLLLLPINRSLLWVLPLYVSATGQTQVPKMTEVIVSYGQQLARGASVGEALTNLFQQQANGVAPGSQTPPGQTGPDSSTTTTTAPPASGGTTPSSTPPATTAPTTPPSTGPESVQDLARQAQDAFNAADQALRAGDLGTYQAKITEAKNLVQRINAIVSPPTSEKPAGA
jgi:uncharacterized membrane protein (UPF0182 family)